MLKVLFVGQKPETVDFSDPSLPPGLDAEKIRAGIEIGMTKMKERGWLPEACMISPDEAGRLQLLQHLSAKTYDCVVIGGGIRLPPKSLMLFETVLNVIHKAAPNTPIAFNTKPEDTAAAAARRMNQK